MFSLIYFLLLCFCFKNLDLLDWQTTQFDFSLSTLFVIFISCGLKLLVWSLHPQQFFVSIFSPVFIGFVLDCVFFMAYIVSSVFSTTHLKHFNFIERFDLNFNFNGLFERSSIRDFLFSFFLSSLINVNIFLSPS